LDMVACVVDVKAWEESTAKEVLISEIVQWILGSTVSSGDARQWREIAEVHDVSLVPIGVKSMRWDFPGRLLHEQCHWSYGG
jgi:hypothetical protein